MLISVLFCVLSVVVAGALAQATTCANSGMQPWLIHGLWAGAVVNASAYAYAVGSKHLLNFTSTGFRYVAGAPSAETDVFPSLGATTSFPALTAPMAPYMVGKFVSAWTTATTLQIQMPGAFNNQIWPCVWFVSPNKQALRLVCAGVGDDNWSVPSIFGWPQWPDFPTCPGSATFGCVSFMLKCALPNGCCDKFY